MKEYYLVPRKIIDKEEDSAQRVALIKPSPPIPAVPQVAIRTNPSIMHLIDLKIKRTYHDYARSLLNHYNESGLVQWNEQGILQTPVSGLDIIDILKKMAMSNSLFDLDNLPRVKLFFSLTSTSKDLFRNIASRKQVFEEGGTSRKRKRGGGGELISPPPVWIAF